MSAHSFSLGAAGSASTSAEPNFVSPWRELRVCHEVVLGDMVASMSLDAVPLLSVDELARLDRELVEEAKRRFEGRRWCVARGNSWTREEVEHAAALVERAVQERLWFLGGPDALVGDKAFAAALWDAQWQAHEAIVAKTGSRKDAKASQRRAAGERQPLTVCCGRRLRRLPEDWLRNNAPDLLEHYGDNVVPLGHGDGCGRIIIDTPEPRIPKKYCDRCAARAGNTMNAGLAKNARKRLRASRRR